MLPDSPNVWMGVEPWSQVLPELQGLWKDHHQEIAHIQDGRMPLDVDLQSYAVLEQAGILHVVTVRVDEELVGYYVGTVMPHLHYRSTLVGQEDVHYLKPAFRRGWLGVKFIRAIEATLRERGVQYAVMRTKVYADHSALFARCGWVLTEKAHTKWLGA